MQFAVTVAAIAVAASAISFTVWTWREKRNADLVRIGIGVLRVDPQKERDLSEATRKWALDLIDANAGGVKFSEEARAQLLKEPLKYDYDFTNSPLDYGFDTAPETPDRLVPGHPSAKQPK